MNSNIESKKENDHAISITITECEANPDDEQEESEDVVLEMRRFAGEVGGPPLASLPLPTTASRISYLLTLDNRRQQALVELQTLLKQKASDQPDQDPILTKETFCQVFSRRVRLSL